MLFKILLKNLIGYVNIKIEGYFVEKFINKCINNKIFFWNIKREKSTIIYTNVGINEFKKIRKIAKETKCKIEILNKKGLPFILHRYKKRKVFLIVIIIHTAHFSSCFKTSPDNHSSHRYNHYYIPSAQVLTRFHKPLS